MKTTENNVKYSNFNMGEMDKSRELYSKVGDNSSQFERKTVVWEHTIARNFCKYQISQILTGVYSLKHKIKQILGTPENLEKSRIYIIKQPKLYLN